MKKKCSVCGKRFMPTKETTYLAKEGESVLSALSKQADFFDAIDCPRCGCQTVLKKRMQIYEERKCEDETESDA